MAKRVKHIVLMKFKTDTSPEALGNAGKNLVALKGILTLHLQHEIRTDSGLSTEKVPGILDISFGPTFKHDRAQGFTHALVVDLVDANALEVCAYSTILEGGYSLLFRRCMQATQIT
jgi:hypothetical protein